MKKISKILLPISAIAATTTAVTPLVACGGTVNLLNYAPDPRTRHLKDTLDKNAATKTMFGQDDSVKLVKQDILTYLSWELNNELSIALAMMGIDYVGRVKSATAKISNLKIEMEYNQKENRDQARLSGNINLKAKCAMLKSADPTQIIGSYTLETKHELHNVPYWMVHDDQTLIYSPYWTSFFDRETLEGDNTWSVNLWYKGLAKYDIDHEDEKAEDTVVYNQETIKTEKADFDNLTLIRWWSYYLWEVDEKKE